MSPHRYTLERNWIGTGGVICWIMLNPSTADDVFDDPTIRRVIGFSKRWGFSRLVVVNLYAYRATFPSDLAKLLTDVAAKRTLAIGPENDRHIREETEKADVIVCAWGNLSNLLAYREASVLETLKHRELLCIRKTKLGNPAHPVREPYTEAPVIYRARECRNEDGDRRI
jgi:hypothetical protein